MTIGRPSLRGLRFGAATSDRLGLAAGFDNVNTFSVAVCVIPTTLTVDRHLWGKGNGSPPQKNLRLGPTTAGRVQLHVAHGVTDMDVSTNSAVLVAINKPQFVFGTFDGSTSVGHIYIGDASGKIDDPAQTLITGSGIQDTDAGDTHHFFNSQTGGLDAMQGIGFFGAHYSRIITKHEMAQIATGEFPVRGLDVLLLPGDRGAGRRVLNLAPEPAAVLNATLAGGTGTGIIIPIKFEPFGRSRRARNGVPPAAAAGPPLRDLMHTPLMLSLLAQ